MSSNRIFQNYHCHKEYTNVRISDSAATLKEYAARARELGHGILSSCEHGWQGNYYQTVKLAREFGLKPLICAEAYWVKDREEKDRSNCHIFIAAMNENGRQALNDVLSEANITGFYGQPRLDIPLILSLPKDDVVVTTACVAYWRYDDIEEITKQFAEHFGKNFFLEVQYHNTESQRELNRYILELHKKYNIPIIMGCDSHYIFPDQAQTRADFLASKGLTYENEDDWYLDYPDGETAYKRFAEQCVLSDEEICEAMENTNVFLNVEEYNSPVFNEKIKLPTLYPELSQDERNEIYKKLVWDNWAEYKKEVPENQWSHYEDEINKEIQTVVDTRMADYFIDNYYIIKKGKENGGWLTKTGRGCFTKDAIIETENGPKPINEVTTADWVMTHTGDMMPVYKTMRYSVDERLAVVTPVEIYGAGGNGAEEGPLPAPVTCTLDHKFFVKTRYFVDEYGWKKACELKPRDLICIPLGNGIYDYVKVKVSITEPIKTDVYDLGVLGNHSYTVNRIAVHNSGVSFITNKLLGFTEVDRVSAKVHMYPERFMSTTRILESGSLPDLDQNCAPVEPFARAQKEILGEDHSYPMIAYGTMQKSAAWKLYAKSQGINFEIANAVSSQIRNYEFAVKHLNEEEAESVDIKDYIDEEFHEVYEKSKDYLGLVTSWSIAPCSYLLYSGSIRKEIGLVKVKDNLCCIMDGHWAEECHFLKNDLLKVSVVDLIYRAYHRIGMEPPSVPELLKMCGPNDPAWDIYARSCTLGINQCEQKGTSARVAKYKPKNISELAAFVAAIRPGFKSMYKTFESRQHFDYGVKAFDDLIQTEEMHDSFLLYQEQEMAALNYAGIEMSECYTAIKNIAKKRAEKVISYKNKFIRGFQRAIMEQEGKSQNDARAVAVKLWKIIEDSANYSFNACFSGDTIIYSDCNTAKPRPSIEDMYFIMNSSEYATLKNKHSLRSKYLKNGYGTSLSMFEDGRLHSNRIIDIRPAGIQKLFLVETESGEFVKCTKNHKFPTPQGIKKLEELKEGSTIYCKGIYEKNKEKYNFTNNLKQTNLPKKGERGFQKIEHAGSVAFATFREENIKRCSPCKECGRPYSDSIRFEVHHSDFNRTNNDSSNYEWLCASCHKKLHYKNGRRKKYEKGIPVKQSKIKRIIECGEGMTYDVEMMAPAHNLIVNNGILASNSHSYCVALDSLYCAWLKAHHPLEFYETLLKISEEKNDKDKMYEIREEANDYFGISFPSFKFGQDNREIKADLETNSITNAITSIKGFSQRVADVLYECGQQNFKHFTDVLKYLFARSIKVAKVAPLISINYFSDYGNIPTLSAILRAFIILKEGNAKIIKKENVPDEMLFRVFEWACDSNDWAFKVNGQADLILTEYEEYLRKKPKPDAPLKTKIRYSLDVLGYADVVTGKPEDRKRLFIKDVTPLKSSKGDVWAYRVSTKSVGTGKEARITIKAVTYEKNPIKEGDIIKNPDVWRNPAGYWYLFDYEKEGDFEN